MLGSARPAGEGATTAAAPLALALVSAAATRPATIRKTVPPLMTALLIIIREPRPLLRCPTLSINLPEGRRVVNGLLIDVFWVFPNNTAGMVAHECALDT